MMSKSKLKKILIIGASGFLGSYLFNNLKRCYQIIGTYYSKYNKHLSYLNISDKESVNNIFKCNPDYIIHCAGMTRPDLCEVEKEKAMSEDDDS